MLLQALTADSPALAETERTFANGVRRKPPTAGDPIQINDLVAIQAESIFATVARRAPDVG